MSILLTCIGDIMNFTAGFFLLSLRLLFSSSAKEYPAVSDAVDRAVRGVRYADLSQRCGKYHHTSAAFYSYKSSLIRRGIDHQAGDCCPVLSDRSYRQFSVYERRHAGLLFLFS